MKINYLIAAKVYLRWSRLELVQIAISIFTRNQVVEKVLRLFIQAAIYCVAPFNK